MLAIPKHLLCHNIEIKSIVTEDSWGNVSNGNTIQVSFVRLETSDKIKITKEGRQVTLSALLFYDCQNSLPKNQVFNIEDVVLWKTNQYKIASIDQIYGVSKLHHLEIGLVAFYGG